MQDKENLENEDIDTDFNQLPLELKSFLYYYAEFKEAFKDNESVNKFLAIYDKVKCLYPEFNDLEKCKERLPFFALVAHYIVTSGLSKKIGILASNGLVASSSVGDVSVSYQASPYSTKGDELTYFLSLTPYGMEYLAWLARQAGLKIVN